MKGFKENFDIFLKNNNNENDFNDKRYYLNKESQTEILDIQQEKKFIIKNMHSLLIDVDNDKEIFFNEKGKNIIFENGNMYFFKKGGTKEMATKGDIMVAGINGFELKLSKDIDRQIKKEFILRETRRKIKNLYNKQLIKAELENLNTNPNDLCIDSYREINKTKNYNAYESKQSGVIAETMIESYLTKLFVDNPHLPFSLEMADVHEDVRGKIDFKLNIKKEYVRGVKIDTYKNTGIQFTMNSDKTGFKEKQIEKSKKYMDRLDKKPVDDLVLVTISINDIQDSLHEWKNKGKNKSIAGPAEHWSSETKKLVFIKMLEKLPPELGINAEELWNSLK